MNRKTIAIVLSIAAVAAILAATYGLFTVLAAHFPPGRTLGMLSAALMVGSGLACVGVVMLASKWVARAGH